MRSMPAVTGVGVMSQAFEMRLAQVLTEGQGQAQVQNHIHTQELNVLVPKRTQQVHQEYRPRLLKRASCRTSARSLTTMGKEVPIVRTNLHIIH